MCGGAGSVNNVLNEASGSSLLGPHLLFMSGDSTGVAVLFLPLIAAPLTLLIGSRCSAASSQFRDERCCLAHAARDRGSTS